VLFSAETLLLLQEGRSVAAGGQGSPQCNGAVAELT